jgi:hypothetical protein
MINKQCVMNRRHHSYLRATALKPTPPTALKPTPPTALKPTPPTALKPTPPTALKPTEDVFGCFVLQVCCVGVPSGCVHRTTLANCDNL